LAAFHITETEYFTGEDDVVIPKHVIEEHAHDEKQEVSIDSEQKVATVDEVREPSV
jgi:predicted ribonuclease YlaK